MARLGQLRSCVVPMRISGRLDLPHAKGELAGRSAARSRLANGLRIVLPASYGASGPEQSGPYITRVNELSRVGGLDRGGVLTPLRKNALAGSPLRPDRADQF